jgi:endonuclease/exonuclease/phosphatase (EEP) superfamily protein YafD
LRGACLAGICALLFVGSLDWSSVGHAALARHVDDHLALLSFNVHNQPATAETTAAIARRERVDILTLQEVRLHNRKLFVEALPEFAFFWPDPAKLPTRRSTGVFASMIGLRRESFQRLDDVEVLTGITGYRTFAVRATTTDRPIWIVNVHATKPFWLEDGLAVFVTDAPAKARWHQTEALALSHWLHERRDSPTIVAGDFNAPPYANVIRVQGLQSAHRQVGSGLQLTFPASFPVWGIDHVLGNRLISFDDYRLLAGGPSDHLAQLARFSVVDVPRTAVSATIGLR